MPIGNTRLGILYTNCQQSEPTTYTVAGLVGGKGEKKDILIAAAEKMPSKAFLFTLLAALLALLFAPQLGTEATTEGILINAPPSFVKDQVLYYDVIRDLQRRKIDVDLDYLVVTRDGHKFSASNAKKGDVVELYVNEVLRTTGLMHSLTSTDRSSEFVYKESLGNGQQLFHTLTFTGTMGNQGTRFEYEKRWRGSLAMLAAGKLGYGTPIRSSNKGFKALKELVEEEFNEEKDRFGSARYQS